MPLQSAKPAAHVGAHAPLEQAVVPLAFVQVLPHVPQLLVVFNGVSQPFATLASQLAKPELQEMLQLPDPHEGVPLFVEHAWPQPPQCSVLVSRLVSQPLSGSVSQLP